MFTIPQNRYQAFAVHLLISAVIFILLSLIIIFIWYPGFLFTADGGWQGIRLIAGVDFIIGPTLTLFVYKLGKPSLKFDLTVIALIQFACLAAGTWLVYQERPLAVIYANGSFYTMSENSYEFHDHNSAEALKLDDQVPAWIFVELPEDKKERSQLLMDQLRDGPIHSRIDLYQPYEDNITTVLEGGIDPDHLAETTRNELSENGSMYFFKARYSSSYIEIDKDSGEFIALHEKPKPKFQDMKPLVLPSTNENSSEEVTDETATE